MNATTFTPKRKVTWRLRVMLAERGLRSATALHHRLADIGLDISSAHLSRMMHARPKRLSMELLDALLEVLQCELSDLMRVQEVSEQTTASTDEPTALKKGGSAVPADIVGPKVTPFPIAPRTRDKDKKKDK